MATTLSNRCKSVAAAMAAATLLCTGVASASPAHSPAPGSFSIKPAHSNPADPVTRAYFKPVVAPGGTYSDQVIVGNPSDQAIDFIVSPVDGLTGQTSGSVFANRQDVIHKAGLWVQTAVNAVTVPAHKEVPVGFTVTVPLGVSPGDHLAGVAIENAHPQTSGPGGFQVKEVVRAVIGIQIIVPGPAVFHPAIYKVWIEALPGAAVAAVMVRLGDDGLALGKPFLTVHLTGPAGYDRTFSRQLDTLLPGDIIDYAFAWADGLNPGSYVITATLVGGGATATLTSKFDLTVPLKGADVPQGVPAPALAPPLALTKPSAPIGVAGIPWWVLLLVALGGIGAGVMIRRRPHRPHQPPGAFGPAARGQTPPEPSPPREPVDARH